MDSLNWFAITAASASPDEKSLAVICGLEPITNATAMVSPSARPRPISTPATSPLRLCGITAARIVSQRVAPSAWAASFSDAGTVVNVSRATAVTIGVIMMARMRPAVMKERPEIGSPEKSVLSTGIGATTSCTSA